MGKTIRFNENGLIALKERLNEVMVGIDDVSHNDIVTLWHGTDIPGIVGILKSGTICARDGVQHGETYGMNWFSLKKVNNFNKGIVFSIEVPSSEFKTKFKMMNSDEAITRDDRFDISQYDLKIEMFCTFGREQLNRYYNLIVEKGEHYPIETIRDEVFYKWCEESGNEDVYMSTSDYDLGLILSNILGEDKVRAEGFLEENTKLNEVAPEVDEFGLGIEPGGGPGLYCHVKEKKKKSHKLDESKEVLQELKITNNAKFKKENHHIFVIYKGNMLLSTYTGKRQIFNFLVKSGFNADKLSQLASNWLYNYGCDLNYLVNDIPYLIVGYIERLVVSNNRYLIQVIPNQGYDVLNSNEFYQLVRALPSLIGPINYKKCIIKVGGQEVDKNEIINNRGQQLPSTWYHGTRNIDALGAVLGVGIKPTPEKSVYDVKHNDTVFVTSDLNLGEKYAKFKSNNTRGAFPSPNYIAPCVLVVDGTKLDVNRIVFDFDVYGKYKNTRDDEIYNDIIDKTSAALGNENAFEKKGDFIDDTKNPMRFSKIGYRGVIHNNAIIGVIVDGKELSKEQFVKLMKGKNVTLNPVKEDRQKENRMPENKLGIITENIESEVESSQVDLSSFKKKNSLPPGIWKDEETLNPKVRLKLLDIADDFWEFVNLTWVEPKGIVIVGSICNYNWSNSSDIDLHLIVDFNEIDSKTDFVKQYLDSKKNEWNNEHDGLKIMGFPVELYVQDISENPEAGGIYDLEENKWIRKPNPGNIKSIGLNKFNIKDKAAEIMTIIDDMYQALDTTTDGHVVDKIGEDAGYLWKKVKDLRKKSLDKHGESGAGNIVYKVLRRTGYLDKLFKLSTKVYDRSNSITEGISRDIDYFGLAKERFGVTQDIRECGYILPDGTMLDFSDRHYLKKFKNFDLSTINGERNTDHREIKIIGWSDDMNTKNFDFSMNDFIRLGAIRTHCEKNCSHINLYVRPTREQIDKISRMVKYSNGCAVVDIGDGNNCLSYAEYESVKSTRVTGEIMRYFDEGINLMGSITESSVKKYLKLLKEEVNVDGNTEHNPYEKRWKAEREALKNFVANYGKLMQSREDNKGGKLYKVYFDETMSNLIGYNYCICVQWNEQEMKPGSTVYIRALDKFTPFIRRNLQYDDRGRDNMRGTYDDTGASVQPTYGA